MPDQDELIGSAESCRILDVHPATLGRWVCAGTLTPAYKLPGKNGAYIFHRSDIEAIRDEREESVS